MNIIFLFEKMLVIYVQRGEIVLVFFVPYTRNLLIFKARKRKRKEKKKNSYKNNQHF